MSDYPKNTFSRHSSNGCIGLYSEHIAQLFARARVGTQVLVI